MLGYALRRLILAIPLLIGITFVSFLVIHLAPGEPADCQEGVSSTQSDAKSGSSCGSSTDSTSRCTSSTGTG